MTEGMKKFREFISNVNLKTIGGGHFDIGTIYDVYFDELFLGLTLQDNLLYIYYENCPGRDYVICKWDKSKEDFDEFVKIIEELMDRSSMLNLAFHFIDNEPPYLEDIEIKKVPKYNPNYGDDRICKCGHPYHRHFDSYEDMYPCGCKYCQCYDFKERENNEKNPINLHDLNN